MCVEREGECVRGKGGGRHVPNYQCPLLLTAEVLESPVCLSVHFPPSSSSLLLSVDARVGHVVASLECPQPQGWGLLVSRVLVELERSITTNKICLPEHLGSLQYAFPPSLTPSTFFHHSHLPPSLPPSLTFSPSLYRSSLFLADLSFMATDHDMEATYSIPLTTPLPLPPLPTLFIAVSSHIYLVVTAEWLGSSLQERYYLLHTRPANHHTVAPHSSLPVTSFLTISSFTEVEPHSMMQLFTGALTGQSLVPTSLPPSPSPPSSPSSHPSLPPSPFPSLILSLSFFFPLFPPSHAVHKCGIHLKRKVQGL